MITDPARLVPGDITAALALSDAAGWNQLAADWALFLAHGTVFGARDAGRLVASAAILPYGARLGWVSMVLVAQTHRRQGLASRLLAQCVAGLRATGRAALLDATPAGAAVYAKLGFVALGGMQRWQRPGRDAPPNSPQHDTPQDDARQDHIHQDGAAAILACDAAAFGADRGKLLRDICARPGTSLLGGTHGYTLLRAGRLAAQIGPLVAASLPEATRLLHAACADPRPLMIDLLDAGAALRPSLAALGFAPMRDLQRMALGLATLPGKPAHLLAAAGPEYG